MTRRMVRRTVAVISVGLGLTVLLAMAKAPESDSASLARHVGKNCTVYLNVDPIPAPSSGGTNEGVMTKNDTPLRVMGRLTAYDNGIAVVRNENLCHLIRTEHIVLVSVSDK